MIAAALLPKAAGEPLLTSEEFLEWPQPGVLADLIRGEILMHSPVQIRHPRLIKLTGLCLFTG
jgi:hypothetical protein